jgi:hypothetical protein
MRTPLHAFAGDNCEVQVMPGGLRELFHEDALCASIALSEGVNCIEVNDYVGGAFSKLRARKPAQIVRITKFCAKIVERAGNLIASHEGAAPKLAQDGLGRGCSIG